MRKNAAFSLGITALGLAALVTGAAFAAPPPGPPAVTPGPSQPVQVTNTPSNPVPVSLQGTSTVTGNVTVVNGSSNPMPVSVTGTPQVSISGPVAVVPAADPALSAVQLELGQNCYTVPTGFRLVIEFASGEGTSAANSDTAFDAAIYTSLNGKFVPHILPITKTSLGNLGDLYTTAGPLRAYADGGSDVCGGPRTGVNPPVPFRVVATGYLVPTQ